MHIPLPRNSFGLLLAALFVSVCSVGPTPANQSDAQSGPAAIYIIRHAEKPEAEKDPNLTPRGYERANALAHVIPDHFCVPDFIWAAASSKHSARPMETVEPLAHALHQKVFNEYPDTQFGELARDLLTDSEYSGKTILICWHHGEIPNLAKALGARDAPDKWKPEDFDRVWVLTFSNGQVQFKNLPQKALPGDSEK